MTEYARRFITGQEMPGQSISTSVPQPYANVIWVYSCISLLCDSANMLPLVFNDKEGQEIEVGKAKEFWSMPSKNYSLKQIKQQTIGWKALTGECHWILDGKINNHRGIKYIVGKTNMTPVVNSDKTELLGWKFKHGHKEERIALDEIISNVEWHPYDRFRGISPVEAACLSISQNYQADSYNNAKLANNAEPGGILSTDQDMTEDQVKAYGDIWRATHGGNKRGGIAVLSGGLTWQSVALNNREMQFAELKKMTREEIIGGAFKIPLIMVGLVEDANYGYADACQEIYWTTSFPPWESDFSDMATQLTRSIQPDIKVGLNINSAPIFAKLRKEKIEQGLKLMNMGATFNDVNQQLQLGFDDYEWGNEWWVSQTLRPAQDILDGIVPQVNTPPAEQEDEEEPEPDKNIGEDDAKKDVEKAANAHYKIWRMWIKSWSGLENKLRGQMRTYFAKVYKDIEKSLPSAMQNLKDIEPGDIDTNALFKNSAKWDADLKAIMEGHYNKSLTFGVNQAGDEVGLPENQRIAILENDPYLKAIQRRKLIKIVEINKTLRAGTVNKIRKSVMESAKEKETIQKLADRIVKDIKQAARNSRARALTIARTETGQCISEARHKAYQKAGVKTKRWISAHDPAVRQSHIQAERDYGQDPGISMDLPFVLNGKNGRVELMKPRDINGPAGEVINCRCLEIAGILKTDVEISLEEYLHKGFLTWTDN